MEAWKKCLREGFFPDMPTEGLVAALDALDRRDPALIQCLTAASNDITPEGEGRVCGACFVAYVYWRGEGLETNRQVQEAFARACLGADERLGEKAGCRYFLNKYDESVRNDFFPVLAVEVSLELYRRGVRYRRPGGPATEGPPAN